jgi:hypothetical protein
VNLFGTLNLIQAVLPHMKERQGGAIRERQFAGGAKAACRARRVCGVEGGTCVRDVLSRCPYLFGCWGGSDERKRSRSQTKLQSDGERAQGTRRSTAEKSRMSIPDHEATLRRLTDRAEIAQVIALYAIALDTRRPDLFALCFTPDARLQLDGVGECDIAGYRVLCQQELVALDATQHHLGTSVVEISEHEARARTYFVAQHVKNALAPHTTLLVGGWYDDELVRCEVGWRISYRRGVAVWVEGNPQVLGSAFALGARIGSGRDIPAWLGTQLTG